MATLVAGYAAGREHVRGGSGGSEAGGAAGMETSRFFGPML